MKSTIRRTPSELKAFRQSKTDIKKTTSKALIDKTKQHEFRTNHMVIEKYITYSNKRVFLNKKAFLRLIEEGKTKWSLR